MRADLAVRFLCDRRVSNRSVDEFSTVFESTLPQMAIIRPAVSSDILGLHRWSILLT